MVRRAWQGSSKASLLGIRGATVSCFGDNETAASETGAAERPKLMIVDDDPQVRLVVAEFLEEFGYDVLQAEGGARALELLAEAVDLRMIISDIRMPDMSGIELAKLATRQRPDVKIVLISGYFVSQQVDWRFLRKPFRMSELREAVRAELDG